MKNVIIETTPKSFYRVCNLESKQGLWYKPNGEFAGLIHTDFSFCSNSELQMPYDEALKGWLSAVSSIDSLWKWFTQEDIQRLQNHGWFMYRYETTMWSFYEKFQHEIIWDKSSRAIEKIKL
jgi:hypothetical protein